MRQIYRKKHYRNRYFPGNSPKFLDQLFILIENNGNNVLSSHVMRKISEEKLGQYFSRHFTIPKICWSEWFECYCSLLFLTRIHSFSTFTKLRRCAYQGVKNVNFSYVLNKWSFCLMSQRKIVLIILAECSISIPPEKSEVLLRFQRVQNGKTSWNRIIFLSKQNL